jgi:MoaA/NifB/PqqE/SkfB family radical SAM enzyme
VLEQRLEKLHDLRAWVVCLTGGEPTLHPDLTKIVAKMRELGFRRRQMITNGYRLTERLVEGLNEAGLTDLQLSLDGVRKSATTIKVLDVLRGRLEMLARHARFRVVLNAVIGAAPAKEAIEVVDFAKSHGFAPRVLFVHDANGQVRLSADELAAYREVKRRLGRAGREARDYRSLMISDGKAPFRCRAGSRYLYVDEFGKAAWCSQTRHLFAKDLMAYDLADLRRQFHAVKPCNERCSVGCSRTASAFDEWRGQGA